MYRKGLLIHPQESRLAQPLAHQLADRGDVDQALQVLQKAAPSIKSDPEYHSFIAALQQQSGQHKKAIRAYKNILEVQPG